METRKLLVTTDFSEEAARPYGLVEDLARRLGLSITLLHVVEEVVVAPHGAPLAPPVHPPQTGKQIEKARERMAKEREAFSADLDVTVDVISAGDVPRAVAEYAKGHGVDVIALSTHGRTGFRRVVMGSVAENVLRHARVPVLVFPHRP